MKNFNFLLAGTLACSLFLASCKKDEPKASFAALNPQYIEFKQNGKMYRSEDVIAQNEDITTFSLTDFRAKASSIYIDSVVAKTYAFKTMSNTSDDAEVMVSFGGRKDTTLSVGTFTVTEFTN